MSHTQPARFLCQLLLFFIGTQFTAIAFGQGFSVGLGAALPQADTVALNLQATVPVLRFSAAEEPIQLAVRGDLTVPARFSAPPAAGLSVLLKANDGQVRPYLGSGIGISFPRDAGVFISGFAYTGLWLEVAGNWGAALEGSVNFSSAGVHPNLALGIRYTFGWPE